MPPVIGYCAVSNHFDLGAVLLLVIFSLWQMPHSYSIAILHLDDYAAARIPVLPVRFGVPVAKKHILFYIPAYTLAAVMLTLTGYTGYSYLVVVGLLGIYWVRIALSGYRASDDRVWARKMFAFSIVNIMVLSFMMPVGF